MGLWRCVRQCFRVAHLMRCCTKRSEPELCGNRDAFVVVSASSSHQRAAHPKQPVGKVAWRSSPPPECFLVHFDSRNAKGSKNKWRGQAGQRERRVAEQIPRAFSHFQQLLQDVVESEKATTDRHERDRDLESTRESAFDTRRRHGLATGKRTGTAAQTPGERVPGR
jgi:hypothetical protein